MVILFTTYEWFKDAWQGIWVGEGVPTAAATVFGGVSGGLAGLLTTPMDVVKTRIMVTEKAGEGGRGGIESRKMREVWKRLWRENGGKSLWLGAGARGTWWFCVCSLFFPAYERTKEWLAEHQMASKVYV